jgi:tRNA G18 (ribose-2'-O)-methylase SpoU
LKDAGYALCVTTGLGGECLYESSFGPKTILVIGSEARGVSDALMQRADKLITIPLQPECESLNAAVAGSICMFWIARGKGRA